jgi:DNA-directed RNA polymerase beta' subunit
LRKIKPADAELMGFAKGDQPCWMIWTVIPVIPPPERPTMTVSPQRRGEDDLTYALFNLFKANQELDKKIKQGAHASQISPSYELLQFRVATYTTNDLQKQPKVKQRSGRETQGAIQKVKGKEGLVRQNMMGKRVDQSARTVITGDPTLSVEELGVPLEIAMILTKPVPVTNDNFDDCWRRVLKGPFEYVC